MFYGDAQKWSIIFEANKDKLQNPHRIPADVVITIPKPE